VEAAVLNVARYDVPKLGEAVWTGQVARALRMLDGLRAEGEAPCWCTGRWPTTCARWPAPAPRWTPAAAAAGAAEARVWGAKEKLFERALPLLAEPSWRRLLDAASRCATASARA
jgi:DNA polymerase III subunit delta